MMPDDRLFRRAGLEEGNILSIVTPEGIHLALTLAGPGSRFIALVVDYIFILIFVKIFTSLAGSLSLISQDVSFAMILLLRVIVSWGYFVIFDGWNRGQSPGKRLLGLRVVDKNGFSLAPSQVILRNIFRVIDTLPLFYLLGGGICMFSRHYQRIGDMIAGTVVTFDRHFTVPRIEHIAQGKFNSFYNFPHLVSRARQKVSPQESALLLKALLRREGLDPESRVTVYRSLSEHFRSIVDFPVDDISDEQYLRNLLGILYIRKASRHDKPEPKG